LQTVRPTHKNNPVTPLARLAFVAILLAAFSPLAGTGFSQSSRDQPHAQKATPPEEKTDINSASIDQLMKVPGMTRTWAARIIRFRPYRAKNDLLDRGVVTNEIYDRIKDYIIAHRAK